MFRPHKPDPALGPTAGFFVEPTVFADVKPTMRLAREEIFGPVLAGPNALLRS